MLLLQAAVKAANLRSSQLEENAMNASQDRIAATQEVQKLREQANLLQSALERSRKQVSDSNAQVWPMTFHLPTFHGLRTQ